MSQLEQDTSDDATPDALRPGEDPWSSLAVADDDDGDDRDDGIPSPAFAAHGDGGVAGDDLGDIDDDLAVPSPDVAVPSPDIAVPSPDLRAAPAPTRRFQLEDDEPEDEPDDDPEAQAPGRALPAPAASPPAPAPRPRLDEIEEAADETVVTMVDPVLEPTRGGAFTIPLVCAGIAIIACCLLIPQADANRRLAYERVKLQADLEAVARQVAVNEEFLGKVSADPNLAERLAQRQMKIIRAGTKVLSLKDGDSEGDGHEMSPFQLTAVPPPPPLPPYEPLGGRVAGLCYHPKSRLYLMGAGLLLTAIGLVLGFGPRSAD